jgi:thiol-disulfide isomerase/thioredoxin
MPLPRRFAVALAFPLAFSSFAFAAPPTDQQIDALITKIDAAAADVKEPAAKRQARRDAAKEALGQTPLSEATLAQLKKLSDRRVTSGNNELCEAMDARLAELAKDKTVDGATAAEMRLTILPQPETAEARKSRGEKLADLAEQTLKHDGAAELFKSGGGDVVIRSVGSLPADTLKDRNLFELLAPRITTDLSPAAAGALSGLVQPLVGMKESLGQEKFDAIRMSIVKASESAVEKAKKAHEVRLAKLAAEPKPVQKDGEDAEEFAKRVEKDAKAAELAAQADESQITRLKDLRALAAGPWARGELVDHPAPAIAFKWSNTEQPIHSFADLKGKVVLVDFWATWCGPCVAAFPKMRELQTRYSGYPVVILGVTSVQGFSMDRSDKKKVNRIDCKGDPAKEMDLMKSFMKDMDMTWNVAFSEQNVFNPDFGVRGIPSVALIGPDGNVRFAGLYPNPKEESEKIDALLKEAKLPYPENPYVEAKKSDDKKDEPKKDEPKKG